MNTQKNKTRKNNKKQQQRGLAILTKIKKAWSITDLSLILAFGETFLAGHGKGSREGQDYSILPAWVANHNARFGLSSHSPCLKPASRHCSVLHFISFFKH